MSIGCVACEFCGVVCLCVYASWLSLVLSVGLCVVGYAELNVVRVSGMV